MTVMSMTGFGRAEGEGPAGRWVWEAKSVNGRGLDIRLNLPQGAERLDGPARDALRARFTRGSVNVVLSFEPASSDAPMRIDQAALSRYARAARMLARQPGMRRADPAALLALKGVVSQAGARSAASLGEADEAAMLVTLNEALDALKAARASEGAATAAMIEDRLAEIDRLLTEAKTAAAALGPAMAERLKKRAGELAGAAGVAIDADRIAQEAVLLAVKADVREELDRLTAHVVAARALLAEGGAVGRRFDFLAQEFAREANTTCSKAASRALSEAGLALKTVVDQIREQVQNVE